MIEINDKDFIIRTGYNEMDFDRVKALLDTSFWCKGISTDEIMKGAMNSALNVGVFTKENNQIAYCRVISDKTRFAYILDVVVDEKFRRQGIGQAMIKTILNSEELSDVYQWMLITKDAHGVYSKAGFKELSRADQWMEIRKDRPVR